MKLGVVRETECDSPKKGGEGMPPRTRVTNALAAALRRMQKPPTRKSQAALFFFLFFLLGCGMKVADCVPQRRGEQTEPFVGSQP